MTIKHFKIRLAKIDLHIIKVLETSLISVVALIGMLTAVWGFNNYFEHRIYPGVKVGGKSLTAQTPEQALKTLHSQTIAPQGRIKLAYKENIKEYTLENLGIKLDYAQTVIEAYKIGRSKNYLKTKKRINWVIDIDEAKFNKAVSRLDKNAIIPVQNAALEAKEDKIIIKPESSGRGVDMDRFKANLNSVILGNNQTIELALMTIQPSLTAADLLNVQQKAQSLIEQELALIYKGKTYTPTPAQKGEWFNYKGDKIVFADDKIRQYLDTLARKIEVKSIPQRIYNDGRIEREGRDGRQLNRQKALADIKAALAQGGAQVALETEVVPRKVVKLSRPFTPGLYDGKYIEIDLSSQMLYQMEGEKVVGSHLISSGRAGMSTPVGIFHINSKVDRAYSSAHKLYMPYWMAFIGGAYGIHELPEWANGYKEGQNHLGTPISHGCVRLGVGDAAQVYHWADIGIPVYIHK